MSFNEINEKMEEARKILEDILRVCIVAEEALDNAKINLVRAESAKKKARLEIKIAQENLDSYKEQGWNLRKSASI